MTYTDDKIDAISHIDGKTQLTWSQKLNCAAADCFSNGDYNEAKTLELRQYRETQRP